MMVDALGSAVGVRVVVSKQRRLFLHRPVRIHLDDVCGLGQLIGFEAVAPDDSDLARERQLGAELGDAFAVADDRLGGTGYADQLEARRCRKIMIPRDAATGSL
jgi:adenylate cyclase class IV